MSIFMTVKLRFHPLTLMRVVIQRVSSASVIANGTESGSIQKGLLVLMGVEDADTEDDVAWLSGKIVQMRIFDDAEGVMNLSLKDIGGEILLISQFTLHASTRKGNRPSYIRAAKPPVAIPLYESMIQSLEKELGRGIRTGVFGADMKVSLVNDGPVTILIDSRQRE
jgi:D-tyrosyl-tRNA(Tyr) deacylase